MAFQIVPDTAQVCLRFNWLAIPMQVCVYYRTIAAITETLLQALVDELMDAYIADVADVVVSSVTLREIWARSLESEVAPQATNNNGGTPVPGTISDTVENSGEAFVFGFNSGKTGRSSRGRVYLPGVSVTATNEGQVTNATIINNGPVWTAFFLVPETLDWTHVIVSRYHEGAARAEGVTQDVTTYYMTNLIGSQRNRRVGIG